MNWVVCKKCDAAYAVSEKDDPKDWKEPCEFCGSSDWKIEHEKAIIDTRFPIYMFTRLWERE